MRQLIAGAALAALLVPVAGCGGDDGPAKKAAATLAAPAPQAASGQDPAYTRPRASQTPEPQHGKLVGDSGFVTSRDGFSFANFTKTRGQQIRPQDVEEIYGNGVCVDPGAGTCVLTPDADRWRQMQNQGATNGHCYGFATLALRMHRGEVNPTIYGAPTAFALQLADRNGVTINPELEADLTRDWAVQGVASVRRKALKYRPKDAVQKLISAFNAGEKDWVLSIFMPGVGGHAVVPTGVEDMGGGKYDILLYDNNFPYIPGDPHQSDRRMHVDTNQDRWDYTLSTNPNIPEAQWFGVGLDNPIELVRSEDQTLPQPCPFCDDAPASTPTTVALTGDDVRHGKLRITDAQGRVTGWNGTRRVNEIPGAKIRQQLVLNRARIAPEPNYELPSGRGYSITVVDVPRSAGASTVHVSGPGVGVGLSKLTGAGATLRLGADGRVAVDQGAQQQGDPRLQVALGNRAVTVVPSSDRVALVPQGKRDLKIRGAVSKAVARDAATGKTAEIPRSTVDLVDLVGSG